MPNIKPAQPLRESREPGSLASHETRRAGRSGAGRGVLRAALGPLVRLLRPAERNVCGINGDTRWSTKDEITDAGMLAPDGIIVGELGGQLLRVTERKNVLLYGPCRSGKGSGAVIPNLLSWGGSTICVDVHGENFQTTSGYRERIGQKVIKFSPFDANSETHRWNPFSYVSRDPRFVVGHLQRLAAVIYPVNASHNASTHGDFFIFQARNLFVALSLYCIESKIHLTMGELLRRSKVSDAASQNWQTVCDSGATADATAALSEGCVKALRQVVLGSDAARISVQATFEAPLSAFLNPLVDAATSDDDFDLCEVRRERMSIYLEISPAHLAQSSALVKLFLSTAIEQNTRDLPELDPTLNVECLLILDELSALGRLDSFVNAIGQFPSYGLRVLTIAQSKRQLQDGTLYGYGGTNCLVANHQIQVFYAPRALDDAQDFSQTLGYFSAEAESRNAVAGEGASSRGSNTVDQRCALMLPQEFAVLGNDRIVVVSNNCKPFIADKVFYFKDKRFVDRVLPAVRVAAHNGLARS